MKILVVSSRCPFGNKEPYLRTELAELVRYVDSITVVPVRTPRGTRQALAPGIDVLAWPMLSFGSLLRAFAVLAMRPRVAFRTLWALARSHDPGHVKNAMVALKGLALAHWAMRHGIAHIHAYWLSVPATVAMIAGEVGGIPWSATAHRWDIYERNALDLKARSVAFVRTISERGTRDLTARSPQLRARIVQMPLGAIVPARPRRRPASGGTLRIVCPAALEAVKGHVDLLEAVALLRERGIPVNCTLAGEGRLREEIERRIAERGLADVVRLAGFVPQVQLHEAYDQGRFDVVVLASRDDRHGMEGIPSALVEAMARGVPVVSTNSGSIGELIDDRCGRLVPPGDPDALAGALLDVYLRPFNACARAARAYARVAESHDVRRQMRAFSERIHA